MSYAVFSVSDEPDPTIITHIDQPVGVGYSLKKDNEHYCTNETCVAMNFYKFLQRFLLYEHTEYAHKPIYLTGESYAGHYIPSIMSYILRAKNPLINLAGIAIGNGMMSRPMQILAYPDYVYMHKRINHISYLLFKSMALVCSLPKTGRQHV